MTRRRLQSLSNAAHIRRRGVGWPLRLQDQMTEASERSNSRPHLKQTWYVLPLIVTFTAAPFLRLTSSPFFVVRVLSIRIS